MQSENNFPSLELLEKLQAMPAVGEGVKVKQLDLKILAPYLTQASYMQEVLRIGRYRSYDLPYFLFLSEVELEQEWAYQVARVTGEPVLVIAPVQVHTDFLAVGAEFPSKQDEIVSGVNVICPCALSNFSTPEAFAGVTCSLQALFEHERLHGPLIIDRMRQLVSFLAKPRYHMLHATGISSETILLEEGITESICYEPLLADHFRESRR
jgi:hypothetical protein